VVFIKIYNYFRTALSLFWFVVAAVFHRKHHRLLIVPNFVDSFASFMEKIGKGASKFTPKGRSREKAVS
jgi:hypothetical protein